MVHLISYDLNKPGQDYTPLIDAIKSLGSYNHCLKSGWFVDTSLTASQVYARLRPHIDKSDSLLITLVTRHYFGQASRETIEWLKQHVGTPQE